MDTPTLEQAYIGQKTVLIRTGFDTPIDEEGNIKDDKRIRISVPTFRYLLDHGAKQILVITHIGRPDPKNPEQRLRTDKVASRLSELLGVPVKKIDDHGEKGIPSPDNARIVMFENLRLDSREKSKDEEKRDEFGKFLAGFADIYVNDSFSTSHRDHASMTSIPKFIPGCAGLSLQEEVNTIKRAMEDPERPFVSIIGGVKADKLNAVNNLLDRVDKLLIGGALAFTLLKHMGKEVGKTKVDTEGLEGLEDIMERIRQESSGDNPKVVLPVDCVVANEFSDDAVATKTMIDTIKPGWMALDIGPETVESFKNHLGPAKTVIWNGPLGAFELSKFREGTKKIAETLSGLDGTTIVGGGDTAAAVDSLGLADDMTLVSSGGGASLKMFEGEELVAIRALKKKKA